MALAQTAAVNLVVTSRALTLRSISLGVLLVGIVNVGAPYAKYILHSSLLACNCLPFGVMFPLLVVVAIVNPLIKVARARPLASEELVVIL